MTNHPTTFASTGLKKPLLSSLDQLGYTEMTPIQSQSIPAILQGRDVIAKSKTGSGKTAAFALGLLHNLDVKRFRIQSLILCPTRELANQVASELRKIASSMHNVKVLTLCGGMAYGPQIGSLEHGAHIIVGTPGRIEDHLRKQRIDLSELKNLVLDEADRMLEMGFEQTLTAILDACPKKIQHLLFSATFPDALSGLIQTRLHNPVNIDIQHANKDKADIDQHFYLTDKGGKDAALSTLLRIEQPENTIVFCATKIQTQEVCDLLNQQNIESVALHGDMQQRERDFALVRFANQSARVLVATDVAARGLDIPSLALVVNYSSPRTLEIYTHRIGRTGRAGNKGQTIALCGPKDQFHYERLFNEEDNGTQIQCEPFPYSERDADPDFGQAPMTTIQIDAGKKQKLRAGDILGGLTATKQIQGSDVGKITIFDTSACVAIIRSKQRQALKLLNESKMKGRQFRARTLR